jgi:hypothetical protein
MGPRRDIGDGRQGDCGEQDETQEHHRVHVRPPYLSQIGVPPSHGVNPPVRLKFRGAVPKIKLLIRLAISRTAQVSVVLKVHYQSIAEARRPERHRLTPW